MNITETFARIRRAIDQHSSDEEADEINAEVCRLEDAINKLRATCRDLLRDAIELYDLKTELNKDYSGEDLQLWRKRLADAENIINGVEPEPIVHKAGNDIPITAIKLALAHLENGDPCEAVATLDLAVRQPMPHATFRLLCKAQGEADCGSVEEAERLLNEALPPSVLCILCAKEAPAHSAHLHQGSWIGECCWDERLKASE